MRCLRSKLEEYAFGRTVDELAPSVSSLVRALVKEDLRADYANSQLFIELTQPTEGMSAVLSHVLGAVRGTRGRFVAMLLDADMGSGKTHLLALLLHLFYSLRKWPQLKRGLGHALAQLLGDGIDVLNEPVAVLAVDMKTGSAPETLELFAKSLEMTGDRDAAGLIRNADHDPRRIGGEELARKINSRTNLLILVDELFGFAVMNCDRADHEMAHLLRLIYELVQRRRPFADSGESAVVLLAASARSDYRAWRQISGACKIVQIDQFERDLQRVRMAAGARWVSVEEAVQIAARRLGLSVRDFSRGLYDLAEKALREDTPFPQAHHLRGLLKAMAAYALAACEAGHGRATAAHLTETAISALLGIDASRYKSIYDVIRRKVGGDVLYAVNAVFTGSMVGDPERLAAVVAGDRSAVSSTERWLMEELQQIMPTEAAIKAVKALETIPHIRVVESGGEAAYVVTPFLNVKSFLMELFNEALKTEAVDAPRRLKEFLLRSRVPGWANVVVAADGDFDPKQLRDGALNLIVVLGGDPRRVLERARGFAAAAAPKYDALAPAFAKESAFMRAVSEAKVYLETREGERVRKAGEKIYERIMESYRRELLDVAVEKASEVFGELTRTIADALSDAYYKTPTGAVEPVKVRPTRHDAKPGEKMRYETLLEGLELNRNEAVGSALARYLETLAQSVGFIYDPKIAEALGRRFEPGNRTELSKTNRVAQVAGQYYAFSRDAYEAFLQEVRKEALRRGCAVYERGDLVVVEQRPQQTPPPRPATPETRQTASEPQPAPQPQRTYGFDAVLQAVAEGAEVEVSFVVADPGLAAALLNAVRGNVKRLQVKSGGQTYTYVGG